MDARRLNADFGVELADLDLVRRPERAVALVADALRDHRFVLVRGQSLTVRQQLRFASHLGILASGTAFTQPSGRLPEVRYETDVVDVAGSHRAFYNEQWHTDLSWARQDPPVTVLYAEAATDGCTPTSFADTVRGYRSLDDATRQEITGWRAYHHVGTSRAVRHGIKDGLAASALRRRRLLPARVIGRVRPFNVFQPGGRLPVMRPIAADVPGVAHPVVQHDPGSGQAAVYLGDHAWTLEGHDVDEGRRRVDALNAAIVDADNVHDHHWRLGDLVLFDNRSLLHRRASHDGPTTRTLRRCVVWPAPH